MRLGLSSAVSAGQGACACHFPKEDERTRAEVELMHGASIVLAIRQTGKTMPLTICDIRYRGFPSQRFRSYRLGLIVYGPAGKLSKDR